MDHLIQLFYVKELSNCNLAIWWHNTDDQSNTQRINWENFSFLKGEFEIKDEWNNQLIGTASKNFEVNIGSLDALLLKLTPIK
jgi:hypothetical protein